MLVSQETTDVYLLQGNGMQDSVIFFIIISQL